MYGGSSDPQSWSAIYHPTRAKFYFVSERYRVVDYTLETTVYLWTRKVAH